jgi:hypothetical protein
MVEVARMERPSIGLSRSSRGPATQRCVARKSKHVAMRAAVWTLAERGKIR